MILSSAYRGALDDLVVHVREVADVRHGEAAVPKVPHDGVEHHVDPGVSEVREIVHRRAAHVDTELPRGALPELLLLTCERVEEADHVTL
jgi:hypothetical protein